MKISTVLTPLALSVTGSALQVLSFSQTATASAKIPPIAMSIRKRAAASSPTSTAVQMTDATAALDASSTPIKVNGGSASYVGDTKSVEPSYGISSPEPQTPPSNAVVAEAKKANDNLKVIARALPIMAIATVLVGLLTKFMSNFSSPAAQGLKLVYAGAIAGIVSRSFCAPIEMVSTVMMCRGDECTSMRSELAKTWRKEGLRGMFKGNGANCAKVAPSRGTQFLVYEFVKRKMLQIGIGIAAGGASAGSLHAGARLCAGGIAGMVAAALVYPLEVVKTMLTLYPDRCGSISDSLRLVYKSAGVGGLYRGLGPTLIAMFPYVGVEFMVYETLKKWWEMKIGPVGTATLLLLGAIGGAAAQASAHPLDVIRRRMQMQSMNSGSSPTKENVSSKKYSNMFTGLHHVATTEGVHVLFNGLGPACFEKIPSTAIGYFIYEFLKIQLKISSV